MEQTTLTIDAQRDLFSQAVHLLGGIAPTARAVGWSDRTIVRLMSGKYRIHDQSLQRISVALLDHAQKCRALERRLSPAFAENRTEAQAKPPKHDGNADRRAKPPLDAVQLARAIDKLGLAPRNDTFDAED